MDENNRIIVIVEDDQGINELISGMFKDCGSITKSFYNATDAFEWFKSNTAFLLVLDYGLPEMNGVEFINTLRLLNISVPPFIVSTGQGDERIAVEMMKLGARDYVVKDGSFLEMISIVATRICAELENENELNSIQEQLKQRELYLTAIIENLPGFFWLKDIDGHFLMTNSKFAEACSKNSVEELLGLTDRDLWINELANKYMSDDLQVIDEQKPFHVQEKIFDNGVEKWVETFKAPVFNSKKTIVGTAGYSHDITERRLAAQSLKASEELYRNLVHNLPDGVYKSTFDGKFIDVNPAMVKMLGYDSKEELLNIDILNDLYFETSDRHGELTNETLVKIEVYRLKKKDGSEIWVEDHGWYNLDENGEILTHEGILRDITERKRSEDLLSLTKQTYVDLVNTITEAIYIIDENGIFIDVNKGTERMYLRDRSELIGKTPAYVSAPNKNDLEDISRVC